MSWKNKHCSEGLNTHLWGFSGDRWENVHCLSKPGHVTPIYIGRRWTPWSIKHRGLPYHYTLYIYLFYCVSSYNQVADLPRWGILCEEPFTHEGNYYIAILSSLSVTIAKSSFSHLKHGMCLYCIPLLHQFPDLCLLCSSQGCQLPSFYCVSVNSMPSVSMSGIPRKGCLFLGTTKKLHFYSYCIPAH